MQLSSQQMHDALGRMPPAERARAVTLLQRRYGVQPLDEYICEHHPREPPPRHLRPILETIEEARHRRVRRCFSMPPRHGKTVSFLRGIGWWLQNDPADTCAYYSYSDKKAWEKSKIARRWASQAGLGSVGSAAEWRLPGTEGGVLSGGLRSGLTGQGVSGLFLVDDPFKNRIEADSQTIRNQVYESFNEVVYTRLEGGSVVVMHTRWHPDDLIGRLALDGWEVINFPAIAMEDDPLGRSPGEELWPGSRYDLAELESIRKQINDWSFSALYQGMPQPRGAQLFNDDVARFTLPHTKDEWRDFLTGKYLLIACDPAATASTRADYSVAGLLAFDKIGPTGSCWVLDVQRGQWTVPALVRRLAVMQQRWRCRIVVEAVAGFKSVPQILWEVEPSLVIAEVKPTTDKFARAQPVSAAWNSGRVLVPAGDIPWVTPFMGEVCMFTGVQDAYDDQVDMLSHGWNAIAQAQPTPERGARQSRGAFG